MASLKVEFHEQCDEEMNICLLERHLKMSKSHANLELTTFNRHRVKFRFKLCSPYLFCLFKYIHVNSEWDVKYTNFQILSLVYIFASRL